jgi:hypothetical protein
VFLLSKKVFHFSLLLFYPYRFLFFILSVFSSSVFPRFKLAQALVHFLHFYKPHSNRIFSSFSLLPLIWIREFSFVAFLDFGRFVLAGLLPQLGDFRSYLLVLLFLLILRTRSRLIISNFS